MPSAKRSAEFKRRFKVAAYAEKWAVTMAKVCIRRVVASAPFPRWHLLTFSGPDGRESRGVVDMLAIRKDHGAPPLGAKRGDLFQVILIQVKGGFAAMPTEEDGKRLRIVARKHGACAVLLAIWRKREGGEILFASANCWKETSGLDGSKRLECNLPVEVEVYGINISQLLERNKLTAHSKCAHRSLECNA